MSKNNFGNSYYIKLLSILYNVHVLLHLNIPATPTTKLPNKVIS